MTTKPPARRKQFRRDASAEFRQVAQLKPGQWVEFPADKNTIRLWQSRAGGWHQRLPHIRMYTSRHGRAVFIHGEPPPQLSEIIEFPIQDGPPPPRRCRAAVPDPQSDKPRARFAASVYAMKPGQWIRVPAERAKHISAVVTRMRQRHGIHLHSYLAEGGVRILVREPDPNQEAPQ